MNAPTTASQVNTIDFHGQPLAILADEHQQPMIAIKPICENVGLKWHGQFERIKRDSVLGSVIRVMRTTATDGKTYSFTCLPLDYLNGWLFGIDDKRIKKPDVRQRILEYKRECYRVLADYWTKGHASNPRQPDLDLHYPAERWQQLNPWLKNRLSLSPNRFHISADLLYGPDANTPINHLITQLSNQGHDMQACWMELMAMRHHLETARNALSSITRSADYANSASLAFRTPR